MDIISDYDKGFLDGRTSRIQSLQKELEEVKADVAFYKERCLYTEGLQKQLAEAKAEAARYKSHLENICADFTWSLSAAKKEARRGLEE